VLQDHALSEIDAVTIHVWPQNWDWYQPTPAAASGASLQAAITKATTYVLGHARMAATLGKPLLLEEFGLARDGEGFVPSAKYPPSADSFAPATFSSPLTPLAAAAPAAATDGRRREFYAALFALVLASHGGGGSGGAPAAEISGVSFWAWAGEGRPSTPGGYWQRGDALLGDPPHERQGWYSVYDDDREMSELIARTAARIHANASAFYA